VVRREAHAVDQNLPLIERTEIARLRVSEADDADEFVVTGSVTETVLENCSAEYTRS